MRQGLKMLQMTALELRAELQHELETNPVIDDVTSRVERQMSVELPASHAYGEVTEKPLEFGTGENMASAMGTGRFGADMQVELVNDGPVSVELLADAVPR
jgi:DNA-directed RNA polymerase specialized sigma54-like protein